MYLDHVGTLAEERFLDNLFPGKLGLGGLRIRGFHGLVIDMDALDYRNCAPCSIHILATKCRIRKAMIVLAAGPAGACGAMP